MQNGFFYLSSGHPLDKWNSCFCLALLRACNKLNIKKERILIKPIQINNDTKKTANDPKEVCAKTCKENCNKKKNDKTIAAQGFFYSLVTLHLNQF